MNTSHVIYRGRVYRVLNGEHVEVKVVRQPTVLREGYTVWRGLRTDGPTAKKIRQIAK